MMHESSKRIAIVGFGRMAEVHHLAHLREAGWEVAAVCDITPSRRALAESMDVELVCESVDELLSATGDPSRRESALDAVLIATHSSIREEVAIPLAERGIHLLIEKPLAVTACEAERICAACEAGNVVLSVFHNRRWDRDAILLRQVIDSGVLGELVHLENRAFHRETAVEFGAVEFHQRWRISADMGGGTLLDFGPHWIDQVLTALPARPLVTHVLGEVHHLHHGDADDFFDLHLVFENGIRATMTKSDAAPIGPGDKWFVQGAHGSAVWRDERFIARTVDGREHIFDSPGDAPNLHRAFLEAIRDGRPPAVTGRESLRTCRVIDAARRSSDFGRGIDVEI